MANVTRDSKAVNGCLLAVRSLPLERFRLPTDGRKWRFIARQCAGCLEYLASFANGDGTFTRVNERGQELNYSPSEKRCVQRFAQSSYYRLTNRLQKLGLLSWDRRDHHHKRIYRINVNAFYQEHLSDSNAQNQEHLPGSHQNTQNTSHGEQVLTPPTESNCPSLDSPSKNIPSKDRPKTSAAAQPAALSLTSFFPHITSTPPTPQTIDIPLRRTSDTSISILLTEMKYLGISQSAVQKIMLDTFGFSDPRLLTEKDFAQLLHIVRTAKSA